MFQGIRNNSPFYILEKGESLVLKIGQVVSVTNPQPKYGQYAAPQNYGVPSEMFVDVKVKVGEEVVDFKQLNANLSIANSGHVVVSDSREAMNAEIEGLKHNSKQILDSIPYHERVIEACEKMLSDLNPQFAKEKEHEEKIGALERKMNSIDGTLNQMMGLLTDAIGNNKLKKE